MLKVSSKWNIKGANTIIDPFKKNWRLSDFLRTDSGPSPDAQLSRSTKLSSFPKWYEATIKKSTNVIEGNNNHNATTNNATKI